jgi:hypothetical protein
MTTADKERLERIASQIRSATDTLILARVALQTLGNCPDLPRMDRLTVLASAVVVADAVAQAGNAGHLLAELMADHTVAPCRP